MIKFPEISGRIVEHDDWLGLDYTWEGGDVTALTREQVVRWWGNAGVNRLYDVNPENIPVYEFQQFRLKYLGQNPSNGLYYFSRIKEGVMSTKDRILNSDGAHTIIDRFSSSLTKRELAEALAEEVANLVVCETIVTGHLTNLDDCAKTFDAIVEIIMRTYDRARDENRFENKGD